jgi:hypothetical protein
MLKRWSLLAAAIVIVGAVGTAMVLGIAQQPPPAAPRAHPRKPNERGSHVLRVSPEPAAAQDRADRLLQDVPHHHALQLEGRV